MLILIRALVIYLARNSSGVEVFIALIVPFGIIDMFISIHILKYMGF